LPDGDETVVDWTASSESTNRPLLIILHGLESSAESSYAQLLLAAAIAHRWDACVLHFRDCGDYRNKLPRRYHAGETADVAFFVDKQRLTRTGPIALAGYSLGGNVLLKYLGEAPRGSTVAAAAAICVPMDLQVCSTALQTGASRFYQRYLLKNMREAVRRKFTPENSPFDWHRAMAATTFDAFDDAVTAPLHGFQGKDDYYAKCSSRQFLKTIETPTLIINALDDPFMSSEMLPEESELSGQVTLELSRYGGHVGFIEGGAPGRWRYFLPERILGFLASRL
jgi:predicted alpha/beta-fold hydrolase